MLVACSQERDRCARTSERKWAAHRRPVPEETALHKAFAMEDGQNLQGLYTKGLSKQNWSVGNKRRREKGKKKKNKKKSEKKGLNSRGTVVLSRLAARTHTPLSGCGGSVRIRNE